MLCTWSFFFISSTWRSCSDDSTLSILCMSLIRRRWDSRNWSLARCHVCFSWLCCCRSNSSLWQTEVINSREKGERQSWSCRLNMNTMHTHTSSTESAAIQKSYTRHLKPFYWHFKSNLRPNLQWKCKLASVQNEHNGKRSLWTFINVKSKQRNTFKLQHSLLCKHFQAPALTRESNHNSQATTTSSLARKPFCFIMFRVSIVVLQALNQGCLTSSPGARTGL